VLVSNQDRVEINESMGNEGKLITHRCLEVYEWKPRLLEDAHRYEKLVTSSKVFALEIN
jgi:hypothetical protein